MRCIQQHMLHAASMRLQLIMYNSLKMVSKLGGRIFLRQHFCVLAYAVHSQSPCHIRNIQQDEKKIILTSSNKYSAIVLFTISQYFFQLKAKGAIVLGIKINYLQKSTFTKMVGVRMVGTKNNKIKLSRIVDDPVSVDQGYQMCCYNFEQIDIQHSLAIYCYDLLFLQP